MDNNLAKKCQNTLRLTKSLFDSGMVSLDDSTSEDKKQFNQLKKDIKKLIEELGNVIK